MNKKCSSCNKNYEAQFLKKLFRRNGKLAANIFVDQLERRVSGSLCYECQAVMQKRSALNSKIRRNEASEKRSALKEASIVSTTEKTCSSCGMIEAVIFHKTFQYGKMRIRSFRALASGRIWYGSRCPECINIVARKKRGYTKRAESKRPQTVAAVGAETLAATHFRNLGFEVQQVDCLGPDLKCRIGKLEWTVEVKRATRGHRCWRVALVRPLRQKDDLVAIVLPNGRVYIDSMEHHLSRCTKNGSRAVTEIIKEFGLP